MTTSFRSTHTSLLSSAVYGCTKGVGAEHRYSLIERDDTNRKQRMREATQPDQSDRPKHRS